METLIVIGWLLLTIIPLVGYLVVSGINAKLSELSKVKETLQVRKDVYTAQRKLPTSKASKRNFKRSMNSKVLNFKRK